MNFKKVYHDHFNFVYRLVARMAGPSNPDIEDIVQDVFSVAYRKIDKFDGTSKPTTWLYGICWRVVSQYWRKKKVESLFTNRKKKQKDHEESNSLTPEEALSQQQTSNMVYEVLNKLNFKKRQVLILYEIEEYSGAEIAEMVGCKEATVWTRLHKARKDFKQHWTRYADKKLLSTQEAKACLKRGAL
jgi:RNA polymerase sigma-70 factor (ECF subfamily)